MQAGERTSHLFRLANLHGALVLGTGDLSELALGFTTYGVGDHMSHYNVNASVPKTLIQHLIRWLVAHTAVRATARSTCSTASSTTRISPELVPGSGEEPEQSSEDVVGPYELQDFNLYYLSRFGYRPSKVAFLAHAAWGDRKAGAWPDTVPDGERREYDLATIRALARGVPAALLPGQPVQALGDAERAEGGLRRIALAAQRLARAERFARDGVARRIAGQRASGRRRSKGAVNTRRSVPVQAHRQPLATPRPGCRGEHAGQRARRKPRSSPSASGPSDRARTSRARSAARRSAWHHVLPPSRSCTLPV